MSSHDAQPEVSEPRVSEGEKIIGCLRWLDEHNFAEDWPLPSLRSVHKDAADMLEQASQLAIQYDEGRVQDYDVGVKLMEIFGLVP